MIKNRLSYDIILASLKREDHIQSVYLPELDRHAEVVFVRNQLYIAEGTQHQRIWYPLQREALATEPAPSPPSATAPRSVLTNVFSPPVFEHQAPPPPYSVNAQTPVPFVSESAPHGTTNPLPSGPMQRHPEAVRPRVASNTKPASGLSLSKFVNPQTGQRVSSTTPGAIPASTFQHRKPVDPKTGKRVLPGTPGAIPASTFQHRRSVDPATGKRVPEGTPNAIPSSVYYRHRAVDPTTGKTVPPGTPGAVTFSVFDNSRPVHPDTGQRLAPGTPGAITLTAFRQRRGIARRHASKQVPGTQSSDQAVVQE